MGSITPSMLEPIFTIVFDSMKNIYNAGDEIKGHVLINFPITIKFSKLIITCKGEEKSKVPFIDDINNTIFNLNIPVLDLKKECLYSEGDQESDKQKYEFKFNLPNYIPSSFFHNPSFKNGQYERDDFELNLIYFIEACLEDWDLNQKCSLKNKAPFIVREKLPQEYDTMLNQSRSSYLGVSGDTRTHEVTMNELVRSSSVFACLSHPKKIEVTAVLPKNVFKHGENINLQIIVQNDSNDQFAVIYSVKRTIKYVRPFDKLPVTTYENYQPELFPGVPAAINISPKAINLLNGVASIEMQTSNLSTFSRQPSLAYGKRNIEIKDNIHLRLLRIKGRNSRVLSECFLPIYIYSTGFDNTDHNGKHITPIDVEFQNRRGQLPTFLTPYLGNIIVASEVKPEKGTTIVIPAR